MHSLRLRAYLRYLASTNRPILIGPFRSELGFEVLYWIPFIHWALKQAGIDKSRCLVLSRGGMGHLYGLPVGPDLYKFRSVDEVRLENAVDYERRKIMKQVTVTQWDRDLAQEVALRRKLGRYHLLHPAWMYRLLTPLWHGAKGLPWAFSHLLFKPLPVPELPNLEGLPQSYVAMRFYDRHTLPMDHLTKKTCQRIAAQVAAKVPVVLLNQPHYVDDHVDLAITGPNIHLLPAVPPEQNFVLQAAVLARANAFIGTYGGVAQWALRYGKPSISFYQQFNGTAMAHRALSEQISALSGVPFEVGQLSALRLWEDVLTMPAPQPTGPAQIPAQAVSNAPQEATA